MAKIAVELKLEDLEALFGLKSGQPNNTSDLATPKFVEIRDGIMATFFEKYFAKFIKNRIEKAVLGRLDDVIKQEIASQVASLQKVGSGWDAKSVLTLSPRIKELVDARIHESISRVLDDVIDANKLKVAEMGTPKLDAAIQTFNAQLDERLTHQFKLAAEDEIKERVEAVLNNVREALKVAATDVGTSK